jgi:hypothetical protein
MPVSFSTLELHEKCPPSVERSAEGAGKNQSYETKDAEVFPKSRTICPYGGAK